ncbi:hypothetical protein IGB42_04240 [Andreprevotia sp. IGB-42]|uniref:FAD/NAD(P)-binding protein n=1 Tax=Andreprevotia sp. IGB-42 TaxID=2497473 RepID=UPI00135B44CE|nr:FAD/NAD(P)-binding protein [Andreprevotia sp. IGB-42]KAF0811307.1 hypothetical protein IGB42_04240 [Andreprevotia sp. IGB-42]
MNEVIAIIGGGSTAASFLYNYLQSVDANNALPRTIYLFEQRSVFGPGAAYEPDLSSNILNTKTGFITPFHDRPGDFFHWLKANLPLWQHRFPAFHLDEHSYAPRPLFGLYLQAQFQSLVKQAAARQVNIIQIQAEVNDVFRSGHGCVVETGCNLFLKADYVFFLCGTLPAKRQGMQALSDRVLATPYPVSSLKSRIPHDAAVGIVGARLSCIDAVIALVEQGHQGPITIHSRSGYFPSVRGTQGRIVPRYLTAEQVETLVAAKGKLRLRDLVDLVQREIAWISGSKMGGLFQLPLPPHDLATFLRSEIAAAAGERVWQAVLYSTNLIIDQLWAALHEDDKHDFLERYFSIFMAYRVSIPVENARKILGYLESGQLQYRAGSFDVGADAYGGLVVTQQHDRSSHQYDYLINATGSPRVVDGLDSELISRLIKRGIMTPHKLGGVQVDTYSYQLLSESGQPNTRLRVVGELTTGAFFFTSALDINARHARQCVTRFADFMRNRQHPQHAVAERAMA